MKITAVKISMLRVPNAPPVSTYYKENRYVVARIQTDAGIEGLGYTMLATLHMSTFPDIHSVAESVGVKID